MTIIQIRIIEKKNNLSFEFDVLTREDATKLEIEAARIQEKIHLDVIKKIAKDANIKVNTYKIGAGK